MISRTLPIRRECPNCGGHFKALRGFETKNLAICECCRFIFDRRIASQQELDDLYRHYSYSAERACPPATIASYSRLLLEFERYRKAGKILDVGCGQGDFLAEAGKRGWAVCGTEFSPQAVERCRERGLDVRQGNLELSMFDPNSFDVVTSFEVFEHIDDAPAEIRKIHTLLRPGGMFYMTTPNFNSVLRYLEGAEFRMIAYPEHISYYTPVSAHHLARDAGFEVIDTRTTGLDLARVKAAVAARFRRRPVAPRTRAQMSANDDIRNAAEGSKMLQIIKAAVNGLLTAIGAGDTLKIRMRKKGADEV